ncbi:Uncharacterized protein Rs2_05159 [Raphanus sativus]|nr:Uncharacterized protein Rs2_05159 [Raphanus sativus]
MTEIEMKNLFICLLPRRLVFSSAQTLASSLEQHPHNRFWEASNVRGGGELMSLDILLLDSKIQLKRTQGTDKYKRQNYFIILDRKQANRVVDLLALHLSRLS